MGVPSNVDAETGLRVDLDASSSTLRSIPAAVVGSREEARAAWEGLQAAAAEADEAVRLEAHQSGAKRRPG
jgi:hypothetical protein